MANIIPQNNTNKHSESLFCSMVEAEWTQAKPVTSKNFVWKFWGHCDHELVLRFLSTINEHGGSPRAQNPQHSGYEIVAIADQEIVDFCSKNNNVVLIQPGIFKSKHMSERIVWEGDYVTMSDCRR